MPTERRDRDRPSPDRGRRPWGAPLGAGLVLLLVMALGGAGCVKTSRCLSNEQRSATGWEAAERLFRQSNKWLGGDSIYSVDLGQDRILWMFGDSFVDVTGADSRSGVPYARNTVALQTGYDPARASLKFYWGKGGRAFFPPLDEGWIWPGPGVRLGSTLLIFVWRMKATDEDPIGFAYDLPEAALIANPDDAPDAWQVRRISLPTNPWGIFLGTGAVVVEGGHLHVLSCACYLKGNHDLFIARWPLEAAARGELEDPEWATSPEGDWVRQSQLRERPMRLFANGHTEFSVHFDAPRSRYLLIQQPGFPNGDITMRSAARLTGPWSTPRLIYKPPEQSCSDTLMYAAKAHPVLRSAELGEGVAISYATNSTDFATMVHDPNLYYPRFIRFEPASESVVANGSTPRGSEPTDGGPRD